MSMQVRFTIRCPDHPMSDGRLLGLRTQGYWHDSFAEASAMAAEHTENHLSIGLNCVFEVVTDEHPLDLTPEQALFAVIDGVDVVEGVDAGLLTIDGKGKEQLDAATG